MKKQILSILIMLCLFSLCVPGFADVVSTGEPAAGDSVYIAGNPDLYPLEYYNEKTECYEGILPNLFQKISEQTGIDFAYIAAAPEDRQKELAENLQVEIVSAYHKGEISVEKEIELFSYIKDGQEYTVCIGFTKIFSPTVAAMIEETVQQADKDEWLAATMGLETQASFRTELIWLAVTVAALIVVLIVLIVCMLKKRRARIAQDKTKMTDPMTGIGNLDYFKECYIHHISPVVRQLYFVGYIAIEIEKIETYFGTAQSEELQRYAADTVTHAMRDSDFAARIDNGVFAFAVLCPDTNRAMEYTAELVKNLNAYNKSYAEKNGVVFRCGLYPLDKQNMTAETVIYNARQGYLYAVGNKRDVCLCGKDILDRVSMKSRLQKKILSALEKGEFQIYLQLVYDVRNQRFYGAEVLSRWHSRDDGVLSPANYLDDMKLAGMIDKLDFYIFDKTCAILNGWKGTEFEDFRLSCNFTRTTLSLVNFREQFEKILCDYDFDRSKLLIEITEDSLVDDSKVAYQNVLAIKALGCRVALDDFGSGYTSFRDLCDYPLDVIKIDRNIVAKGTKNPGRGVLVGIVHLAHSLGMNVLCEGVETEEERETVTDAGCDYIQGFFYSRVLPFENALDFYKNQR